MSRVFIPSELNRIPPVGWPPSSPSLNELDSSEFARALCQMWWRIPEPEQSKITLLVVTSPDTLTNGYALLERMEKHPIESHVLQQIKNIIHSASLLTLNQKRTQILKLYATHHLELKVEQRELLAGIVAHMAQSPLPESAERVIASGLTNGCDFEAFELFVGLLMETVRVNEARRST